MYNLTESIIILIGFLTVIFGPMLIITGIIEWYAGKSEEVHEYEYPERK